MANVLLNPEIGDTVRDFELAVTTTGEKLQWGRLGVGPTVLLFYPYEQSTGSTQTLLELRDAFEQFRSRKVVVAGVSMSTTDKQKVFVEQQKLPFPLLSDPDFQTHGLYGALRHVPSQAASEGRPAFEPFRRTLLLSPDMRVVKIYDEPDPAAHAEALLRDIDAHFFSEPVRRVGTHAPVLLIPNVFSPQLCTRLMQVWEEQGNGDSGFMREVDGKTIGAYDYKFKIRRDHFMRPGPDLDAVKKAISARVMPKIIQAFNYQVSRFEDFRIACYDSARGGYFRPHRDNTTPGTAHRRFAMSLLLNDEYEGGALRFPEFGLNEYRPPVGGAVVFSCSLLHEATDITAGRRFVLLSFFYGETEAKRREEYNKQTGGNYRVL